METSEIKPNECPRNTEQCPLQILVMMDKMSDVSKRFSYTLLHNQIILNGNVFSFIKKKGKTWYYVKIGRGSLRVKNVTHIISN